MKQHWLAISHRFEALEVRERLLVAGAVLATICLAWDLLLLQPMEKEAEVELIRKKGLEQRIKTVEAEQLILQSIAQSDPNADLRREAAALPKRIKKLDEQIDSLASGLIAVQELPLVLHGLLKESHTVKILSMETLPVEKVTISGSAEEGEGESGTENDSLDVLTVNRHGLGMVFEGDFQGVHELLLRLEGTSWDIYWDSLEYKVIDYPRASISLNLFVLSAERGAESAANNQHADTPFVVHN